MMLRRLLLVTISTLCSSALIALPQVEKVASGTVDIAQAELNTLQINQTTDKAIINWQNFNIDTNEKVHFQQPNDAVCLNRIDATQGMSQIHGNLSATGNIYLINPAGVLFGSDAKVNVGGLVASTIDIADQNFNDGKFVFDQVKNKSGAIINRGFINASEDGIALLAAGIDDSGVIQAKMGHVVLASGEKFTVDFYGDEVVTFSMDMAPATQRGKDENGKALPHAVNVSGEIHNDGGVVYLSAKAAQGVFDNLINMSGVMRARAVQGSEGAILLTADGPGTVSVTGTLDVSGVEVGADQGAIAIIGENISLKGAVLDASNDSIKSSFIAIGVPTGVKVNYGMPYTNTKNVYVGQDVTIKANGEKSANGGHILVSSDKETAFYGKASARGGAEAGNGGLIQIFSKGKVYDRSPTENIAFWSAAYDVSAPKGNDGSVVIGKLTSYNMFCNKH